MIADTLAAVSVAPLPWCWAMLREFGRTAAATGMPMLSSPVSTATRVIPMRGANGMMWASVAAGSTARWAPS